MNKWKIAFCALVISLALPITAHATNIKINSVSGIWTNVTGNPYNLNGNNTKQISWGKSTGNGQSSYKFQGKAPPIFSVDINTPFKVGTFTHYNKPIQNNSITGATLDTTFSLTIDGVTLNNLHFSYNFLHNETPNSKPCQAGSASVCDDIVKITNNVAQSNTFKINGVDYTISFTGFKINGQTFSEFFTKENYTNTASLVAVITKAVVGVPEPETYLTLGSFILAGAVLAALSKRRKTLKT